MLADSAWSLPSNQVFQQFRASTQSKSSRSSEPAARATYDGRPGHPVLIKRGLYGAVAELEGDTGARDLLVAAGAREIECGRLCRADDVDTGADLAAVRATVGGASR